MSDLQLIIRLLLAVILSGIIGFERELHGRIAGLRTHILVGIGSCLIMLTSIEIYNAYRLSGNVDPSRIAAQVVSGIGFLGAGTILRFRASVRGLTTAASLWTVAGIGLAVGCGFYKGALITTILAFSSLFFLTRIERAYLRKDWYRTLDIVGTGNADELRQVRNILDIYKAEIRDIELRKKESSSDIITVMNLKLLTDEEDDDIINDILRIKNIKSARWE
ncbi:MAG: MgtC/SapB family protein [Candidatus Omnitrophica bacterium]|nr:MgtC/SapB family protein [Candidatus Omnitrophota bacterium]